MLSRDDEFDSSKEHPIQGITDLAFSLLQTLCKALEKEMHLLEEVVSLILIGEDEFALTANLRRRISREGPWAEVDIYHTYEQSM
jgi:hypothetical protein